MHCLYSRCNECLLAQVSQQQEARTEQDFVTFTDSELEWQLDSEAEVAAEGQREVWTLQLDSPARRRAAADEQAAGTKQHIAPAVVEEDAEDAEDAEQVSAEQAAFRAAAMVEEDGADPHRRQSVALTDEQVKSAEQAEQAKRADDELGRRSQALWEIFRAFDLNNSGKIESSELMEIGEARRALGQVDTLWDLASNDHLVTQLSGDTNGSVQGDNFVRFFISELHKLKSEDFDAAVEQFSSAAALCRSNREAPDAGLSSERPMFPRACLSLVVGAASALVPGEVHLGTGTTTMGRNAKAPTEAQHVQIDSRSELLLVRPCFADAVCAVKQGTLSRKHVSFCRGLERQWTVRDEGGKNGVLVNNVRLSPMGEADLAVGDLIALGGACLQTFVLACRPLFLPADLCACLETFVPACRPLCERLGCELCVSGWGVCFVLQGATQCRWEPLTLHLKLWS